MNLCDEKSRAASNSYLDALTSLHVASVRRAEIGNNLKPEWIHAMDQAIFAANALRETAGITALARAEVGELSLLHRAVLELCGEQRLVQQSRERLQRESPSCR